MWLMIGIGAVVLVAVVASIWALKYKGVRDSLALVFSDKVLFSKVGKNFLVVIGLVLFLTLIKAYTVAEAESKAEDWLTSYNGVVTTNVVGPIEADTGPSAAGSPTPTPSATPTPAEAAATPTPQVPIVGSSAQSSSPGATAGGPAAVNPNAQATPIPTPPPTAAEKARMDAQLRTIRDRGKHHADVMAYFYVNYFVAIVMVMVAGLIVAVTLFFIAQQGWTGANSYVKAIFIVASLTTAFYGLFPPVFQQEKNITDNKELFLKHKQLESEVESYPVTHLNLKHESRTPREFINDVDIEISRLANIALGFDVTKINYQDAINLRRPTPAPNVPAAQGTPTAGGR